MPLEDTQPDAHRLQVRITSHLKFAPNAAPRSDDDLTQLAHVFALEFGQILKSRLNAIAVRYADVHGRTANASTADVTLNCIFSKLETAQRAREFLGVLNPIAESWADEVWRVIRHGILSTENSVRLVGGGADWAPAPRADAPVPAAPAALGQAAQRAPDIWPKALALLASAIAGAFIMWAALSVARKPTAPVQACASGLAPAPTQTINVSCPTPPAAVCRCERQESAPLAPASRRWSSEPGY